MLKEEAGETGKKGGREGGREGGGEGGSRVSCLTLKQREKKATGGSGEERAKDGRTDEGRQQVWELLRRLGGGEWSDKDAGKGGKSDWVIKKKRE